MTGRARPLSFTLTLLTSLALPLLAACGGAPVTSPSTGAAGSAASGASDDRDAADKALDAGRKPKALIDFIGVKPGWKVADIAAGGGYTTELLARAVGAKGVVYAQNNPWAWDRFAKQPFETRMTKPVMKNVVQVVRELEDPLPGEATNLDAVVDVLFYHDTFWLGTDREKMNAAIFRALKPGGVYVVIDHSGRLGTGTNEVKTLHRIEESVVRKDIEKAGFKLDAESKEWRNASDARDWNASPGGAAEKRGQSDRFALRFVKP